MWNALRSLRQGGKSIICGLVAIASSLAASAQTTQPATSAGHTPGSFDVSATGQATYSIPLWTPPGTNGVEPKLSLAYTSNNRASGWISAGWSLAGLSQIVRCQKTIEYDNAISPVYLEYGDAFCLDGERLEVFSGSSGFPNSTYRTKIEQYSLVTAKETAGNGPAWFEVATKDGLIYEYGRTANSRAVLPGSNTPYLWSLSKIRDRQGNNLIVNYVFSSGVVLPSTIQYTQSPANGADYSYTIVFNYAARDADDTLTGFIAGSQFSIGQRLASLDVRYGGTSGTLLRRYQLTYADSPTTQHGRLAAVQECGGSNGADCLSPTTISYQNGQSGIATPATVVGSLPVYLDLRIVDINGDGRSDLVYSTGPNGNFIEWFVSLAGPSGFSAPINTGLRIALNDVRAELLIGDFLGIGRLQLLGPDYSTNLWCTWYWGDEGAPRTACSTTQVDTWTIAGTDTAGGDAPSYAAADVNGDGRSDLIWASALNGVNWVWASFSAPAGAAPSFIATKVIYPIPDNFAGLYGSYGPHAWGAADRMDFNGDAREDLILVTSVANQLFTAREVLSADVTPFNTGPTLADVDGVPQGLHSNDDACTDMEFSSYISVSACNGAAGYSMTAMGAHAYLDWNGDGRTEALYRNGTLVAIPVSQGAPPAFQLSTGLPSNVTLIPLDYDADGLIDLMSIDPVTRVTAVGLHLGAGTPPDLLSSVVDGQGNRFSPTYKPITQSNHTNYGAVYPNIARPTPLYVVDQFSATDGAGGTYTNQFHYYGARWNARGFGFLGFESKRTLDSRTGLYRSETYSQDFPTIGWLKVQNTLQPNNSTLVRSVVNTLAARPLVADPNLSRFTYFPYVQQSVIKNYEVGGPRNGALIGTGEITNSYDDWGTLLSRTVKTTEGATGLNSGAEYTEIVTASDVGNDPSSWCLNKPRRVQHTRRHSLTGGTEVTRTFAYNWDLASCRLNQRIVEPDSTRWAATTDYEYDAVGNVNEVTVTPAAGQGQAARTFAVNWGTSGRLPRTFTDSKGHVTSFGWNEPNGVRTSVTDPNNLTTTTTFDNFNRVTRQLRPDGTATDISRHVCSSTYVYCASADVRTYEQAITRDTANNAIRTDIQSFDGLGRPRYSLGNLLSGAMKGEITTYNSRGLISGASMPFIQGEPVWYSTIGYDVLGRPTSVQRPTSEANSTIHTTQFSYEGLSQVKTDALGRTDTYWFNALGDTVRVVDAGSGATNYEYDAFGNLLKVRDAASNETSMTYNVLGMKMTSNDPDAGAWSYDYYPLGELKSQTDAKSQTTTFTYDVLSRLLTRVDLDGTTQFTYDTAAGGVGQRATASSPGYSEEYSYDIRGRLSQTRITADSATYQYDYGYSSINGLLEYLTYPTSSSGFRFKVRYDYQYGLMQKVSNYSGDVLGAAYWEGVATNARGQYIDEQYGNGLRTISGYDRIAGWLDDRTTGRSGATSLQNFTYQWDALGNLTRRTDSYNNSVENFYYDSLDRLDYSTLNGTTNLDLAYDAIGNITSKSGVGSYTYHATKRHAVVSTTGTVNNTFAYDANGSMETRNGQPITWYRNGLPRKINASTTVSNEFWYGPDGERWKQLTTNGTATGTWTYIGGLTERLVTSTVNEFRHYVHGPNGVVAVYKRPASGTTPSTTYVTTDHLGSLDVISNTAGVEMADAAFSAFGERVHFTGSGPPTTADLTSLRGATRRGFTFQEHLDETGLIHMNGRVYDPVIARFISPDPFVQSPFNGQSLNRYSYVLNNPLRYTDPSGYFSLGDFFDDVGDFFGNIGGLLGNAVGIIGFLREFYRETGCSGVLCGLGPQNPPKPPPSGLPTQPQSPPPPRPTTPASPPTDTAVPGVGQPPDAVNTSPAHEPSIEDFLLHSPEHVAASYGDNSWSLAYWNVLVGGWADAANAAAQGDYQPAVADAVMSVIKPARAGKRIVEQVSKKIPIPKMKSSPFGGKIEDKIPTNGVPRNWTRAEIEDAIVDYRTSIATRKAEQAAFDAMGGGSAIERLAHARRITDEENFLKALEKALGR